METKTGARAVNSFAYSYSGRAAVQIYPSFCLPAGCGRQGAPQICAYFNFWNLEVVLQGKHFAVWLGYRSLGDCPTRSAEELLKAENVGCGVAQW